VETVDLHLKLVGTSHLSLAEPFAVIEDQRNNQQSLYKLGSDVADAGKLVAIEKERVVIDHAGQLVALEIPKTLSSASADGGEKLDAAEAYRKSREARENLLLEHGKNRARDLGPRPDPAAWRSRMQAERVARHKAREARRAARRGLNPAAPPQPQTPQAPPADPSFRPPPDAPGNPGSESD